MLTAAAPARLNEETTGILTAGADAQGKQRKTYPYEAMMTPYDKLKSLPTPEQYLKPGLTFKQLDDIVCAISDNEAARQLNEAKRKLFKTIFEQEHRAA